MTRAPERRKIDDSKPVSKTQPSDYNCLTNDQLGHVLREKLPHMAFLRVTDDNRQTVIAMLEITERR